MFNQSVLVRRDTVELAFSYVLPMIEQMLEHGLTKRKDLHVVAIDPVSGDVLFERSFGVREKWEHRYDAIARSKAELAWMHERDTRELMAMTPYLLVEEETLFAGGIWLHGIVVAASGVESHYDEAIAYAFAAMIRAIALGLMAKLLETGVSFIPSTPEK